MCSNCVA